LQDSLRKFDENENENKNDLTQETIKHPKENDGHRCLVP